jgi:hypothetical protein
MKALNIFFIALFIFSAIVQYNDPDPYVWVPIYLLGAYICYLALRGRSNRVLNTIALAGYSLYAIYLFIDKSGVLVWWKDHEAETIVGSMKASTPWIEETREFFGLLILITAVVVNIVWLRRTGRETAVKHPG